MVQKMYSYFDSNLLVSCGVCIVVGLFLVVLAVNLFSNSSPFSQSFGQYFLFGFVKWDDFARILLIGALMAGWGIWTLVSTTTRAVQYQAAHESVLRTAKEKADANRLAAASPRASAHHAKASNAHHAKASNAHHAKASNAHHVKASDAHHASTANHARGNVKGQAKSATAAITY